MGSERLMKLFSIFRPGPTRATAHHLHTALSEQARHPYCYVGGVPDSLDGRFELIALHAFLVLRRLKQGGPSLVGLAQALFDVIFADLDQALRESGVGDMGVGKRVKTMASGLLGRIEAYDRGVAQPAPALEGALRRNLLATATADDAVVARIAAYVRREATALAAQGDADLLAGRLSFGPPPPPESR